MQGLLERTTKSLPIKSITDLEVVRAVELAPHGADDLAHLLLLGRYGLSAQDAVRFLTAAGFSGRDVIRSLKRARCVAPV